MGLSFNRGELSQALARFLGLKGEFPLTIDQQIIPQIQLGNIVDSPYLNYATPCQEDIQLSAVAAENGYVWPEPGANVVLQVKQIIFGGDASAALSASIGFLSAANIATIGVGSRVQMRNLGATAAGELVSSSVCGGTHTSNVITSFASLRLAAGTALIWTLPDPGYFLYGSQGGGNGGSYGVCNLTQNEVLRVAFNCREWPLPG